MINKKDKRIRNMSNLSSNMNIITLKKVDYITIKEALAEGEESIIKGIRS